ncbi:MAG: alpha/beta fold hydrolase [Verrucomicrobia bacterium]|nr:alpha/beta fold hydrolase [Verrucomicrobiota bacterium]
MSSAPTVIVLHGLARTSWSMRRMARFLAGRGYRVDNVDYPSRRRTIEELADEALGPALARAQAAGASAIHFVTHSMGGILTRAFLRGRPELPVGRVVMLCPPNRGSDVVDHFRRRRGLLGRALGRFFGPASFQLATDGLPTRLGALPCEVGVIAGTVNRHPLWGSLFADQVSDGTVPLERTKLDGMADFRALPYSHTFIMDQPDVQTHVGHFLAHGRFAEE